MVHVRLGDVDRLVPIGRVELRETSEGVSSPPPRFTKSGQHADK